ncbi:MAG: hypothetical protein AVDCRST_MAG93-6947 [uncultured Chloroflexia bacterium]|uniref:Uncharacterized protein n=1 Tax=uncultured Chloroflexia bacterium TaxID=1672391 RepID=A0A6J4M1A6_9CHLR|nr:MAG: hypothetical protein AVDCRST_MAG93-6947 [uncultured Chloroflexia bacterium]
MPRHAASLFTEDKCATMSDLVEACLRAMLDHVVENLDTEVILSWDKPRIEAHVRGIIHDAIDHDREAYAELVKEYLTDHLLYRIVARSYFD